MAGEETEESSGKNEDGIPEETPIREPGLEDTMVSELLPIDPLSSASVVETDVGEVHRPPGEKSSGRRERLNPVEGLAGAMFNGEEGEEGAQRCDEDSDERKAVLGALSDEDGCLPSQT